MEQQKVKTEPFVIESTYKAPVDKVWQAITDKHKMKDWYFDLPEFKAEVGFEFQFIGGTENNKYLHLCKIAEVVPNQKLSYSWRYDGYPGDSLVTFELFELGDKTRLKLTHSGLESFPTNNPDFAEHNFAAGWTYIVCTSLKDYIEKV